MSKIAIIRTTGYDRVLLEIRTRILALAEAVREVLLKALATLEKPEQQEDWRALDQGIDQERDRLLEQIVNIMSLQQLRKLELRWMLGHQRMVQELERIADYACDVAELSRLCPEGNWAEEILQMADYLLKMYDYVLAILKNEQEIIKDINTEDDSVDRCYAQLKERLLGDDRSQSLSGELGLALVLARTMERLGDHIVNVGEMQVYIKTGQRRLGG
ncbi:phosphate signaling complex PhoU family protein [Desulfitobacterium sp.]|uniref:Phosphate-specific transport system accessory protein PhoU n=1 Tax=bioreactor metagenome TaxID=1076179 RepID=A0A645GJU1_9ZZZZ|nr:PhoU domain-containing protein [Desulfitobacterium sp.]MEA4901012.1 PhoU domain-containing protein [Desulfitobacterium sp.]